MKCDTLENGVPDLQIVAPVWCESFLNLHLGEYSQKSTGKLLGTKGNVSCRGGSSSRNQAPIFG